MHLHKSNLLIGPIEESLCLKGLIYAVDFSNGKVNVADFTREVAIEDDINLIFNSTIRIKFKY